MVPGYWENPGENGYWIGTRQWHWWCFKDTGFCVHSK
ncbi:rCG58517, partial [Rattus norvegicus]